MATLPIFIAHIQCIAPHLGPHAKKTKGYPDTPQTTGEHLRKRRLDLGMTQEHMAERFGVSVTSYNKWEGDRNDPSIEHWPAIIGFLGYDPSPHATDLDEALTALQRRHGLDRVQLALSLGIQRKSLFNWVSGRKLPSRRLRLKIFSSTLPGVSSLNFYME